MVLRVFLILSSVLASLASLSGSALAAQISFSRGAITDPDTILIRGRIELGDDVKFKRLAFDIDYALVVLDSKGGVMAPALEIGRALRFKGFATAVLDSDCLSACAAIWLAGKPRRMSREARIAFHAPYYKDSDGRPAYNASENARFGAYMNSLGLGDGLIKYVTRESPSDLVRLTKPDADRFGLPVEMLDDKREAYARHNLALSYRSAPKPDLEASVANYRFAADEGYAGSQNNLGDDYETGTGVPKNEKAAIFWYTRAAERGEPTAYLSLSTLLPKDTSDPSILVEALKFALLASEKLPGPINRAKAAESVGHLRERLSAADQGRAEELAREWTPLYQEPRLMADPTR